MAPSPRLSEELRHYISHVPGKIAGIEGLISEREMRFLALLGGVKLADGLVLEIGSYQGKSTVVLAGAAKLAGDNRMIAVDPLHEEHLIENARQGGHTSLRAAFDHNVAQAGHSEFVELHQDFSHRVAVGWDRPLRLLWIDGDHRYSGALQDFTGFAPHLADGGVIALHDTLNHFEGSLRVFAENVLLNPHFGPCGILGSISWARYYADPEQARPFAAQKLMLYRRLSRLVPFLALGRKPRGMQAKLFKLYRSRVPHREISPDQWLKQVA